MKTIQTIFLLSASFIIFSCSEEEKPSFDESMMVGNWEATALDYSGTTSTAVLGQTVSGTYTGEMMESDMVVEFTSDPNEFVTTGSYVVELATTIEGETITEEIEIADIFEPGTWKIEGNKLIVTNSGTDTQEVTIEELTATSVTLSTNVTQTIDYSGFTVTNVTTAKYTLKKVE